MEPGETPTFEKPTDVESGPVDSQGLWPKPLPSPWGRFVRRVKQSWLAHELGVRRPHAIGRFQGIRMLGKGGCGIVMLARDPKLGRDVAIKLGQQPRADEMLREAQLLARLSHPNIVKVYETGTHEGNPFFVMEHVVGVNGARFIGEAADWRSVLRVYIAAGRGLAAAHRQGVIHGDIKPANLLIGDDGHVQVSDFGKGQVIADGLRVQGGTPQYMAPEVRLTNPATPRSDQWSFCVALWETLEGVRPFPDSELEDWLKAVYHREFVTAGQLQRLMTQDLRSILEIGLAFAPGDRFSSMDALVYELDTLLSGELPDPADAARPRPAVQPGRLTPKLMVVALCAACTLGGAEVSDRLGIVPSRILTDDPIARAESAANEGDGETALAELNRLASLARTMSMKDLDQLVEVTEQIVRTLEITSPEHAADARMHGELFRWRRDHR